MIAQLEQIAGFYHNGFPRILINIVIVLVTGHVDGIGRVSHFAPLQRPTLFNDAVLAFLNRIGS